MGLGLVKIYLQRLIKSSTGNNGIGYISSDFQTMDKIFFNLLKVLFKSSEIYTQHDFSNQFSYLSLLNHMEHFAYNIINSSKRYIHF